MNHAQSFARAQSNWDNALPPDDDTSAGEHLDAMQADMVRNDMDPVVQMIVALVEKLPESVESINHIISEAYAHYGKIEWNHDQWGIALSDVLWEDTRWTDRIYSLCRSGASDAELGQLVRAHAMHGMADACVTHGEMAL